MKSYRFDAEALEEYEAAAVYYTMRDRRIGRAFIAAVEKTIMRARERPRIGDRVAGTPKEMGVRRLLLRRFPFTVNYFVRDDVVYIAAVADTRRQPGYWFERMAVFRP